jgi:hypothetical protein
MAPLRRCAPRGERIKAHLPHGHWETMTFLAALRRDRVTAPWLLDGPINGESFRVYVADVLAPTLLPGRHRHHGQSRLAQKPGSPSCHPRDRRAAVLPKILAGTWIPPSSSFAKLNTGSERQPNDRPTPSAMLSVTSSRPSPQPNAQTTLQTRDTINRNLIPL